MPITIEETLQDKLFQNLPSIEKKKVLSFLDDSFSSMSEQEKDKAIIAIEGRKPTIFEKGRQRGPEAGKAAAEDLEKVGKTISSFIPGARFINPEERQRYLHDLQNPSLTGTLNLAMEPATLLGGSIATKMGKNIFQRANKVPPTVTGPQKALPPAPHQRQFTAPESPSTDVTALWPQAGRKALPPGTPAMQEGDTLLSRQFSGQTEGHVPRAPWESPPRSQQISPLDETTIVEPPSQVSGGPSGAPLLKMPIEPRAPYSAEKTYRITEKRKLDTTYLNVINEESKVGKATRPAEIQQKLSNAKQVEDMYNRSDAKLGEFKKIKFGDVYREMKRQLVDVSGNVKKQLLKKGELGKRAVIKHDLIAGSHSRAIADIEKTNKIIYSNLSPQEHKLLDRVIQSRRTIDIESYKTIKHPEGLGLEKHKDYLDSLRQGVSVEVFDKINKKANQYFKTMNSQVKRLKDEGLITPEEYSSLVKHEYSPRQFIQHLDPDVSGYGTFSGGRKISVSDSGIQRLAEGSEQALENDSRLLLSQVISRTDARIARNQANKELHKLATGMPDNGIVTIAPEGLKKVPNGYDKIDVMIDGKTQSMLMPSNVAREWVQTDPALTRTTAKILQVGSGSKILKPMATGFNPEFALANLPRDIAHAWITTQEYSKHLPVAGFEMGKDFAKVAKDTFMRKGRYKEYIQEGGGMEFLTHMGGGGKVSEDVNVVKKVLGYVGETSEIWTRLALRERALLNGKSAEEATWIARNYLDFNQGGQFAKAVDNGVPYLNASIQGTRGIVRAAAQDPKLFAYKVAQIGTLAGGLYVANSETNPECWDAISNSEKVSNWIITTPFYEKDKQGEKRYFYLRIPKDQGQRAIATSFEAVMARSRDGEMPTEEMVLAVENFVPIMPETAVMPTISAVLSYRFNKDFWTNEDIWRWPVPIEAKEEYWPETNPALVKLGEKTGLSPERMRGAGTRLFTYGNIYTSLVGGGMRLIFDGMDEKEQDRTMAEMIRSTPFLRRYLRSTPPQRYQQEKEQKKKKDTEKFKAKRKMWEQYD